MALLLPKSIHERIL